MIRFRNIAQGLFLGFIALSSCACGCPAIVVRSVCIEFTASISQSITLEKLLVEINDKEAQDLAQSLGQSRSQCNDFIDRGKRRMNCCFGNAESGHIRVTIKANGKEFKKLLYVPFGGLCGPDTQTLQIQL